MAETLDRSLRALAQAGIVVDDTAPTDTTAPPDATAPTPAPDAVTPPANPVTVEELIAAANAHLLAAEQAQRDGDWARYGQELAALRENLAQLAALTE